MSTVLLISLSICCPLTFFGTFPREECFCGDFVGVTGLNDDVEDVEDVDDVDDADKVVGVANDDEDDDDKVGTASVGFDFEPNL